jgi:hypothetical protein
VLYGALRLFASIKGQPRMAYYTIFYMAMCKDCVRGFPKTFRKPEDREQWRSKHVAASGHRTHQWIIKREN